jgi:hypothetical protein
VSTLAAAAAATAAAATCVPGVDGIAGNQHSSMCNVLDNLALSYQGCTQRQCVDAVQTLCTCYSAVCLQQQGVQRKACSRHECCPLHKCLVVIKRNVFTKLAVLPWMCSSCGNLFNLTGRMSRQAEQGVRVVEGCSLAGARLGVEQAFTEVLAILYSQSLNNCDWCLPQQARCLHKQHGQVLRAAMHQLPEIGDCTATTQHMQWYQSTCEHPCKQSLQRCLLEVCRAVQTQHHFTHE